MQPSEMITLINHADSQGLAYLVETVNKIQEGLAEGELFPITVLDRLGDIVRRRTLNRSIHASHVAGFLELHRGHVRQDLKLADRWKKSVVAVRDFSLEVIRESLQRGYPLIHSRHLASIAGALVDFHFRDDEFLSASANYMLNPPGELVPWVEHIGDFMMSLSMFDYHHEAQFKALEARAIRTARDYRGQPSAQQALTKAAWAQLSRQKAAALEMLQLAIHEHLLVPEMLNRFSLLRMHQVYFANQAKADQKFALFIDGALTEQLMERDKRHQSGFDQKVEEILIKLGIPFERQIPVAGFWVDFFLQIGKVWVVLECDHPPFHQVVHLKSGKIAPGGKDRTRNVVIGVEHPVIRITTCVQHWRCNT